MAITFSTRKGEELIDTIEIKSDEKVMEELIKFHPELDNLFLCRGYRFNIYALEESFVKLDTKILLVSEASGENHSIGAGVHDGIKNFDHHGKYENEISPCINDEILEVEDNATIEISHIDCDTMVGLLRMISHTLIPDINLSVINEIDRNGTSTIIKRIKEERRSDDERALFYYLGVGTLDRKVNFPRVTSDPQDVTEYIREMFKVGPAMVIEMGQDAMEKSEYSYRNCRVASKDNVGYWVIGPEDSFDPSRPYSDGINIVIVYRSHWKTISIYCNPSSSYEYGGKEIAGILFQGHPKACGSPRGQEMSLEDGLKIFEEVLSPFLEGFDNRFYIMKTEGRKYIPVHIDENIDTDSCDTEEEAELLIEEWVSEHNYEL